MARGQARLRLASDQSLVAPVLHEVGNPQDAQVVLGGEALELGHARHRTVNAHDLADDAGGLEAGHACEVDGRFGVARPRQDAAGLGAQGQQAPRPDQVRRPRVIRYRHRDRARAIVRRHPGADADPGIDWRRKRGLELRRIALVALDERQTELPHALLGEREGDEPAGPRSHEVDRFGRCALRRHEEIALVLAVLVVDENHHAPLPHVRQNLLDDEFAGLSDVGHRNLEPAAAAPSAPGFSLSSLSNWPFAQTRANALDDAVLG